MAAFQQQGSESFLARKIGSTTLVRAIIHASYALRQLQVTKAIPRLLDLNQEYSFDALFEDEFPKVFTLMGLPAIAKLKEYLDDTTKSQFARSNAISCLTALGGFHRGECIDALTDFLKKANNTVADLAGLTVCALLELKVTETIDTIREAFNNKTVNISIPGDSEDVEIDLGLRHKQSTPPPNDHPEMQEAVHGLISLFNLEDTDSADFSDSPEIRPAPKVGRNDPCPCGNGKKFKKCCLH
ncbi:MAG: SEC-C metal-binding domain-containing protein [Methylococcaceae bacterium]